MKCFHWLHYLGVFRHSEYTIGPENPEFDLNCFNSNSSCTKEIKSKAISQPALMIFLEASFKFMTFWQVEQYDVHCSRNIYEDGCHQTIDIPSSQNPFLYSLWDGSCHFYLSVKRFCPPWAKFRVFKVKKKRPHKIFVGNVKK